MTTSLDRETVRTAASGRQPQIQRSLELLHESGDVFEIRALNVPCGRYANTASGYFDDLAKATEAAQACDAKGAAGVYVTLNPVNPALLARANNRLADRPKATTQDSEATCRRWLFIDIDPKRPSGIAATDAERETAGELAGSIEDTLRSEGWSYPLTVDSGNGCYLLYRVDLPNDDETTELLKRFYVAVKATLGESDPDGPHSEIDVTVHNASRILRVGGTINRKGDSTTDRPHRRCEYHEPIEECPVEVVPVERIRAFVEKYKPEPPAHISNTTQRPSDNGNGQIRPRLDVPCYLQARGVKFRTKRLNDGIAYLVQCPFDESHGRNGESAVIQADSGLLTYECKHNGCQGLKWYDYREMLGKPAPDHYDPPLQQRQQPNRGPEAEQKSAARSASLIVQSIGELIGEHPSLRPPVIHGLLRQGETMNVIASPKVGKSWLVADLSLAIVTGRKWLDLYEVEAGKVLIIDNELHDETIAYRVNKVAEALGLVQRDYADSLHVVTLRGCLTDIYDLGPRVLDRIEPGTYRLIGMDALYRFIPSGVSENDNSAIAQVYNQIDAYALQLDCGFACVHHSTKGNQAAKSVTDVGAGAGSQSRATDTHLILRPHVETDAVVLDAAVRSWPPVKPMALRWEWPLWTPDTDLDPTALKTERDRRQTADRSADVATKEKQILDTFVHFPDGATQRNIRERAGKGKIFEAAWLSLTNSGKLTECEVTKSNRQKYPGFKRVYEDDSDNSDI